jgi:TPP-dependent indolepyruvate ferredoxin oxidoreductase alpha subunit
VDGSLCTEDLKGAISAAERGERARGRESYSEEKLVTDVSDRKEVRCLMCGCSHNTVFAQYMILLNH